MIIQNQQQLNELFTTPVFRGGKGCVYPMFKNLKVCTNCNSTYCINGDPSDFWCQLPLVETKDGVCEFCRPTGKYSLTNDK